MPRVSDAHRAARREQILGAALRCVAREGFHKTTMADVIGECGLSAGAVYGYFRGKDEIIRAIADLAIGEAAGVLHDLATRQTRVEPADAVRAFLERVTTAPPGTDVDLSTVAVQAWAEAARDPEILALARDKMGAVRDAMAAVVRRCQHDGTLPAALDPEQAARVLFALLPGFVVQRLVLGDVSVESYVDGLRGLLSC
jgi:AcrR family transcriptional regulator